MIKIIFRIRFKAIFAGIMMKRGFVILICLSYMAGSCVSFIPYLNYALHKDFISKNLCENKSKPEMHCNGKCYIGKEILKLNEQQQSSDSKQQQVQRNEIFPHEFLTTVQMRFIETCLLLNSNEHPGNILKTTHRQIEMPPEFLG